MRKHLPIIGLVCLALAGRAQAGGIEALEYYISNTWTGATPKAITNSYGLSGYVEAISIDVISSGCTGTYSVVTVPEHSPSGTNTITESATTLYTTNTGADIALVLPRYDVHDQYGSSLTGDPPVRWPLAGEKLALQYSAGNVTGKQVRVTVKVKKE